MAALATSPPAATRWLSRRDCLRAGMAVAWLGWSAVARAQRVPPPWLAEWLPGATLVGEGRLTFWGLKVYDARLWATSGFDAQRYEQLPFALSLTYLRALKGPLIAERSIKEMRPLPGFDAQREAAWAARMTELFPDVGDGDTLVGLYMPGTGARFLLNGRLRGGVDDPLFARLFFGIWLSPQTSEPALRKALLGIP